MRRLFLLVLVVATSAAPMADEGMWTFDNVPRAAIAKKYGVSLTDQWLQRLQQSVVRLETGCTASFVSPEGLVLTNHHCVSACLADNSTAERDHVARGFTAATRENELRCQGAHASVLMATENVTDRVTKALAGTPPDKTTTVRNETLTNLESQCEATATKSGSPLACEAVTLYQGGQYWLYKYRRYTDVRLAFAPEAAVAAFGGDPDNFQFPRWCLDFALLRVYDNGRAAATPTHLSFAWSGAADGEPVFVAGHPGTTQRLLTVAQLKTQRDVNLPFWLLRFSELRGRLIQYSRSSPEAARTAKDYLDSIENTIKVRRMELSSLLDDRMMERKIDEERKLRAAAGAAAGAWNEVEAAQQRYREIAMPYTWLEAGAGFNSDLFGYARALVRAADERAKPNASRLRDYTEAALPQLRAQLEANTPVYPEFERVKLSFSLERMREYLGPDHPTLKAVLGNASPDERARMLIEGSTLGDASVRMRLFEGGQAAIAQSTDPMIALARAIDEESRRLRTAYENEVDGPTRRGQQAIAQARFAAYGSQVYPDATFTLRLTYGAVDGWIDAGIKVPPFTQLDRLYARHTGAAPFALPETWLSARPRLDMTRRANFVATTDIVGGNSGSPMVNARGEIVGLAFDGNIHSISGSYWFDTSRNRTVAVHPDYIRTALEQVYSTGALARELGLAK